MQVVLGIWGQLVADTPELPDGAGDDLSGCGSADLVDDSAFDQTRQDVKLVHSEEVTEFLSGHLAIFPQEFHDLPGVSPLAHADSAHTMTAKNESGYDEVIDAIADFHLFYFRLLFYCHAQHTDYYAKVKSYFTILLHFPHQSNHLSD
jgi:hypothetical protein